MPRKVRSSGVMSAHRVNERKTRSNLHKIINTKMRDISMDLDDYDDYDDFEVIDRRGSKHFQHNADDWD